MRTAIAIVLAVGCGRIDFDPLGDGGRGSGSGSARIVPRWDVFPDGTRHQDGVYDTLLATHCEPGTTGSATYACVPVGGALVYADAACTQLVGDVAGATDATYVVGQLAGSPVVYQRGAALAQTQYYRSPRAGICLGPTTSTGLVSLGSEIEVSQLAPLTIVTDSSAGRLQPRSYATTEGLRILIDAYDTQLATHCQLQITTPDTYGCAPDENLTTADLTSDSSCATLLVGVPTGMAPPTFATYFPWSGCQYQDNVYTSVGTMVTPSGQLYTSVQPPTCLTTTVQNTDFYTLGAPVAVAPIVYTPNVNGGGRFQITEYRGDGVTFPEPAIFDNALGISCTVGVASDGMMRCLPSAPSGLDALPLYSDSACTTPIEAVVPITAYGCQPTAVPSYALDDSTGLTAVYGVGAALGTVYENSGGCIPLGFPGQTYAPYAVTAPVDVTTFAVVTITWGN